MTIIVYKDGVLAADSVCWVGNRIAGFSNKIARTPTGHLVGAAGDTSECQAFVAWCEAGFPEPKPAIKDSQFSAIVVAPDGEVRLWETNLIPFAITTPWHCVGVVSQFTAGACAAGTTAEEAVRLAIKHTDGGGGWITVLRLDPAKDDEIIPEDDAEPQIVEEKTEAAEPVLEADVLLGTLPETDKPQGWRERMGLE